MNSFDSFFCSFFPKIRVKAALNDIPVSITASAGLGSFGIPRRAKPKTEPERLATHQEKYGSSKLPPRGTGLAG